MSITRYLGSVLGFITVIAMVLGAYWIWRDYSGEAEFSWAAWRGHAERRWNDFKKGHINLD